MNTAGSHGHARSDNLPRHTADMDLLPTHPNEHTPKLTVLLKVPKQALRNKIACSSESPNAHQAPHFATISLQKFHRQHFANPVQNPHLSLIVGRPWNSRYSCGCCSCCPNESHFLTTTWWVMHLCLLCSHCKVTVDSFGGLRLIEWLLGG